MKTRVLTTDSIFKVRIFKEKTVCNGRVTKHIIYYRNPIYHTTEKAIGVAKYNSYEKYEMYDKEKGIRIAKGRAKANMFRKYANSLFDASNKIVDKFRVFENVERAHLNHLINDM